jgi:hypothetical protein
MTQKMHYGKFVDSEIPITGVLNNNGVEFLNEEIFHQNSVNLTFETWVKANNPSEEEIEIYEGDNDVYLIGSWKKDSEGYGYYVPDESGEYSAIVRESVTQVIWSRFTKRCALCSPCYPGQGDLDSDGDYLAYCLPDDVMGVSYDKKLS